MNWIALIGYPGYYTDGVDVKSYRAAKAGVKLIWTGEGVDAHIAIRADGNVRQLTRPVVARIYAADGMVPPSRVKVKSTAKSGKSKYTYTKNGVACTIQDIVQSSGLTYWAVYGRLKEHGKFRQNGVAYARAA